MSSSFEEALNRTAAPLLAATRAAGLPKQEQEQVNGLAFLVTKHKELKAMDPTRATRAYESLDRDLQEALRTYFGDEDYLAEKPGVLGGAWKYIRDFGDSVVDSLSNYAQAITTPYRAARISGNAQEFFNKKTWQTARDGNRIFDADREQAIDRFYEPSVRKLAKRIATGESFSQILSSLESDEEFATFQRWTEGDTTVRQAVADYDMAKVSIGRDIANVFFDVGVGEFGAERKAFNLVSGSFDAISQVAFDPLSYVAAPFKAMQSARYGTLKLLSLADEPAKYAGKLDSMFQQQSVRQFWDRFGDMATRTLSEDKAVKRKAWEEIAQYAPDFDRETTLLIRDAILKDMKATAINADAAKEFMMQADNVEKIMRGGVGTMERLLPRHTVTRSVRNTLSSVTNKLTGYDKATARAEDTIDDFLTNLERNGTIEDIAEVQKIRTATDRFSRTFERALINRKIFIGGNDKAGRELRAKSAQDIYSLARATGLSKFHSRAVADVYANTDHNGALNIIYGLFDSAATASGANKTAAGRREVERALMPFKRQTYVENIQVDDVDRAVLGLAEDVEFYDPSSVNGSARAVFDFQIADQIEIPAIHEITKIGNNGKYSLLRSLDSVFNNRVSQSVTNYWSALTLLPRLGLRTAIEENLFHAITVPGEIARNLLIGRKATTLMRQLEGDAQLGIPTRVLRKVIGKTSPEERKAALKNVDTLTDFLEKRLTQGVVRQSDEETARYLSELAVFRKNREVQNLQDGITNTAYPMPVEVPDAVSRAQIPFDAKKIAEDLGIELAGPYTMVRQNDLGFVLNFKTQLFNRIENSRYGKLAVEFLENPERAVDEIYRAMIADPDYVSKFHQMNDVRKFAANQYVSIRNLFKTKSGNLNEELLNAVRKREVLEDGITRTIIDADVDMDLLDTMGTNLPAEVFGRMGREVTMHKDRNGIIQEIIDVGFEVADRQVATLSREPVYYAYYLGFRKKLNKVESNFTKKLVADGMSEKQAAVVAGKKYSALASEMAYNRILGYIDNPTMRSNLAFANRNSARYYRATEDFYRRVGRTVVNSPQAVVRLRLASEGLDHAGFIHEDQNGKRYFFMPVDSIMYAAYAPVVKAITGEWPKKPMPIRLSGKIKMLTPSLDPEAALPSFSGPLMAVAAGTVERMLPIEMREGFTRTLLGPYAENASLYQQLMPGTVRRAIEVAKAMDPVGVSEQVHSAAMKSAAYYAANGMAPGANASVSERDEFLRNVQATARNIVAIRNILGIFSPVAPQVMTNADVPEHLLEAGTVSFKDEFNKLVGQEIDNGNPNAYDDALMKWTKFNPGALVYKVSETEMNKIASVRKTRQAAEWIKGNAALLDKHPQGAAFLIPAAGEFDIEAYSFLKREGFIQSRPLEDYFREVSVVQAENEYYDARKEHESRLSAIASDDARAIERRRWNEWSKTFKESNQYLRLELENTTGMQVKRDALNDLRDMLFTGAAPDNATTRLLADMVNVYDNAENMLNSITGRTDAESRYRDQIRTTALTQLRKLAGSNPNGTMLLDSVLKRLLGD